MWLSQFEEGEEKKNVVVAVSESVTLTLPVADLHT